MDERPLDDHPCDHRGDQTDRDGSGDQLIGIRELLTRAREQGGVDRIWSLSVASQALRDRQAPPGPLDWVDGQLCAHLDSYLRGRPVAVPPTLIDTLADLAH